MMKDQTQFIPQQDRFNTWLSSYDNQRKIQVNEAIDRQDRFYEWLNSYENDFTWEEDKELENLKKQLARGLKHLLSKFILNIITPLIGYYMMKLTGIEPKIFKFSNDIDWKNWQSLLF